MSFNFMAAITICSVFGAQKIKLASVSSSICHEVTGSHAMIFVSLKCIQKHRKERLLTIACDSTECRVYLYKPGAK